MITFVCVEGNIGVGKTSVLKQLEQRGKCVEYEPVELWEEANLLQLMYTKKLHLAVFQQTAVQTRWSAIVKTLFERKNGIVFLERSPFSDKDVFCAINVTDAAELAAYGVMHRAMVKNILVNNTHAPCRWMTVLLETDIDTARERVAKRDRKAETQEDAAAFTEYMKRLGDAHDTMFDGITWPKTRIDVSSVGPAEVADKVLDFVTHEVKRMDCRESPDSPSSVNHDFTASENV